MVIVIATIHCTPGKRDQLLDEFRAVVPLVRDEEGCIEYGPTVDVETSIPAQADPDLDRVVVVEKWASIAALEAHLIAPHMLEYRGRVKGLIERVDIQVLEPA
ncbi:MAG: putative quinol monooxygenase [Pirellulaceae bacterium]|nr:antibiotic biosynthesis monooxygenase [Planctomycetales bacterium]